ncbi:MAG: 30S ribosomal protein S18 [Candidatus Omnitrophica bacterium]|nr:30S ribosomal protein S18 [Candidatus Omnitrophota bacterium]
MLRRKQIRKRKPREKLFFRKKVCKFCLNKIKKIDYLDYQDLRRFITERGKIVPSRITGTCARHQRQLAKAIKRARQASLMPYVAE